MTNTVTKIKPISRAEVARFLAEQQVIIVQPDQNVIAKFVKQLEKTK